MKNQMFTDGFLMNRNADVEVSTSITPKSKKTVAVVRVGVNVHAFQPNSRVSKALAHCTTDDIAKRMQGGNFFWKGDSLVSFQYGDQPGFVHTDDGIQQLINHIGYTDKNINRVARNRLTSTSVRLSKIHSDVGITIPEYNDGGELSSQLSFAWSPFQQYVNTSFELIRLICLNGMTGLTSFLNNKIPLVNDWQTHLEIANKQIQTKVTSMISARMKEMSSIRATVRDCQRVVTHCNERMANMADYKGNEQAAAILQDNAIVADPQLHLASYYNANVFSDKRLADQCASHLTIFTLWNMLTELASHTEAVDTSSAFALHKHANDLVFERGISSGVVNNSGRVKLSPVFNNTEAALVGDQL